MNRRIISLLGVLPFLAATALAAPFAITEPPDIPGSGGPTFVLDIGTNTINASVSGCPNCPGSDFQDNFSVTLPGGMQIVSSFLSGSYDNGGGTSPAGFCFSGEGCFFTGFFAGMSGFTGTKAYTASSPYSLDAQAAQIPGLTNYTMSFTVASDIPEPATGLLALPALAALYFARRKSLHFTKLTSRFSR